MNSSVPAATGTYFPAPFDQVGMAERAENAIQEQVRRRQGLQ